MGHCASDAPLFDFAQLSGLNIAFPSKTCQQKPRRKAASLLYA
jgi:hypothetical protein